MSCRRHAAGVAAGLVLLASGNVWGQTTEPSQVLGLGGWQATPVFTIGETITGYTPPGIPDGMGAFDRGNEVLVISNHELGSSAGYPYTLASGASITGGRISALVIQKSTGQLVAAGPAYDTIYNRAGVAVASAADLEFGGLNRPCSAGYFKRGQAGFVDEVFLTGEETDGGTAFGLDVQGGELHALPWLGRAAWESVAALEVPGLNRDHVVLLIGDDRGDAPLLLYVGRKQPGGNFIERNGLAEGQLYMWVADNGDNNPSQFNGTGATRSGYFVEVANYNVSLANTAANQEQVGFDELGFATQAQLDAQKYALNAFNFSRPEDLHTNPRQGTQVVLASTGRNSTLNQGADVWGTLYLVDIKISPGRIRSGKIPADIKIVYDGDDADKRDFGIRSPDNLVWADNGMIYVQEDRSVGGFGSTSGQEASIWELNPDTSAVTRIAKVNRAAIPTGQVDTAPADLGNWETSGIIDVTDLFGLKGQRLLFLNVQAHSLRGGPIGDPSVPSSDPTSDDRNLVQGGQYLFLSIAE